MRTFGVAPNVSVPKFPLYRFPNLGQAAPSAPGLIQAGGAVAGGAVSSAASAAGWGAWAGPAGAAVAVGIAIIAGLIAAHEQRLRDAKTENSRASAAVGSFYQTVQSIISAYNSGQLATSDAVNGLQQLDSSTYTLLREFVGTPGTAWNSSTPGTCNQSCTVSCCLYNTWLHPDLFGAPGKQGVIPVLQAGGGTLNIGGIPTNSYGLPAFPKQTVTINPPSALSSVAGGIFGGGSLLPILLIAGGAALLLVH